MDYEIEIPFGAFDSELMHEEISIPEGFEATIEGNKIILKKIESEDERMRKELICFLDAEIPQCEARDKYIAWLEKQGEQKPTLRERYKNIAKSEWFKKTHEGMSVSDDEKVDNVNKIEPKFKVGDYIERKDGLGCHAKVIYIGKNVYGCEKLIYPKDSSPFFELMFENQDEFRMSSYFQQKLAWSEEDEVYLNTTIAYLKDAKEFKKTAENCIDLLTKLKQRIGDKLWQNTLTNPL